MSFHVRVSYRCDGCGRTIAEEDSRAVEGFAHAKGKLNDQMKRERWLTASRGRYRTQKHYCSHCADRAVSPNALVRRWCPTTNKSSQYWHCYEGTKAIYGVPWYPLESLAQVQNPGRHVSCRKCAKLEAPNAPAQRPAARRASYEDRRNSRFAGRYWFG